MLKRLFFILSFLVLVIELSFAQSFTANGIVVDEEGEGVIGATVVVKGTTNGVVTDIDGLFSINVPESGVLVFSQIGSKTVEQKAAKDMRVVLATDSKMLDEVMVVAYGTAKKSSFTGAAGVVNAAQIEKVQVSSLSKALEGAVPGLQVASDGGQPGSNATLRIRGYGSLAAGNTPLIVLDGVVYDGNMNSINSQDVESITVLKDAASSSLYGSRAANGVILITTKKGAMGKPKVNVDIRQGINVRGIQEYDVIDSPEVYMQTYWKALYRENLIAGNPNPGQRASNDLVNTWLKYNPFVGVANDAIVDSQGNLAPNLQPRYNDSWIDEAYRTGYRQDYNISISSGSDKATSFLSFGYLKDEGIVRNTGFDRFSVRENLTYEVVKGLKLTGGLSYSRTSQQSVHAATNNGAASNIFNFITNIAPIYPVYRYDENGKLVLDADGNRIFDYGSDRPFSQNVNPVGTLNLDKNSSIKDSFTARGTASYDFLDGFSASVSIGYDLFNVSSTNVYNPLYGDGAGVNGRIQRGTTRDQSISSTQLLNYTKTFNKVHNFAALAGHESYKYEHKYEYAQKTDMYSPGNDDFSNAVTITDLDSYTQTKSIESYFGQVTYDYDNRYYFSASLRTDGSSMFHKDNRWGTFWSVGGSWRVSEEQFLKDTSSAISNLRLKASYGTTGNDQILTKEGSNIYKPYEDLYSIVKVNGKPSLVLDYKGNKNLKWEKNNNFNVGFDLGFLENRFTVEFDYFIRSSSDLLYNMPVSPSYGYSYYPENLGKMKNSGIEFTIAADVMKMKDFRWNVTFMGTHIKNKITELPKDNITEGNRLLHVGGSIYDYYLVDYAGVDENTGSPLYYYVDTDNTRKTTTDYALATEKGKIIAGSALPKFSGAFNMTFEYKNFDLSFMTNFQLGGKIMDSNYQTLMHGGSSAGTGWHKDILNAWSEDNKVTDVPLLNRGNQSVNDTSTRFLTSSNYFSLRNISLGYTFDKSVIDKLNLANLRLTLSADNLALFSKRKGLDPRQALSSGVSGKNNITGASQYAYTPVRSFSLGISANF